MGTVLKEAEYQVTNAFNSEDAVKSIENFRPDLIVLNLTMPKTGFDVIEYIRVAQGAKDIPLIVLTQRDISEKEAGDLNERIKGVMNKVVLTKEDLLQELKNTIARMSSAR